MKGANILKGCDMEKRLFDKEVQKKMLGLLPFAPGSFIPWTPKEFDGLPEDLRPVFHMRGFSKAYMTYLTSKNSSGTADLNTMLEGLKDCIEGGKFVDPAGQEVQVTKETVDSFPVNLVTILFEKATELSGLSDLEKESLESQQLPTSEPSRKTAESADVPKA